MTNRTLARGLGAQNEPHVGALAAGHCGPSSRAVGGKDAVFRQAIAVVSFAVLAALPASAQRTTYGAWYHSVNEDEFSGEVFDSAGTISGDEVQLFVICHPDDVTVTFSLYDGIFHNGEISLRWIGGIRDGDIEGYTFDDNDKSISIYISEKPHAVVGILTLLDAHSELRVRFRRWPDKIVTDTISLIGSSRALEALSCYPRFGLR